MLNAADPDPAFSEDGLYLPGDTLDDVATSVKRQTDGKLVVAGATINNVATLDFGFLIQRFNEDGTLDADFGSGGQVITEFGPGGDLANDLLIQPDGKIIAVGVANGVSPFANGAFALARYNADGSLDESFGTGGIVTSDLSAQADSISAAVLQADGKIVVAGQSFDATGPGRFTVARYLADGTLDPSFGDGGVVKTMFVFTADFVSSASAVTIDADGKIVAAGTMQSGNVSSSENFAVARYNADGSLDSTFDSDGRVTINFENGSDRASAIAIQGDGKILVAGEASGFTTRAHFAAARLNPDGSPDATWAGDGTLRQSLNPGGNRSGALSVMIHSDGRVLLAGYQNPVSGTDVDFALARFTETGELDPTFGTGGIRTQDFSAGRDDAGDAILLPGERILVVGTHSTGTSWDTAMAQFKGGVDFAALSGATLAIVGTAGNDTLLIAPAGEDVVVTRNGTALSFPGQAAAVNALNVLTLGGNDSVNVNFLRPGTIGLGAGDDTIRLAGGGAGTQALSIDGSIGADVLHIPANVAVPVTYGSGGATPAPVDVIHFSGSDGDDTINVTNTSIAGAGTSLAFGGVATINLSSRAGNDMINFAYDRPATVDLGDGNDTAAFTRGSFFAVVTVSGGGGDDTVIASAENNGSANVSFAAGDGNDRVVYEGRGFIDTVGFSPTQVAGLPVVSFSDLERLVVNGNGDDDDISGSLGPDGPVVEINGGAGGDQITVNFAAGAEATVNGGDGADRLNLAGTEGDDVMTAGESAIDINGELLPYSSIETVSLNGSAGNDTIVYRGDLALPEFEVHGGGPFGAADVLRLTGSDGADAFTLVHDQRITHGSKIISMSGINAVEIEAGAGPDTLEVQGTIPVRLPASEDLASLSIGSSGWVQLFAEFGLIETTALSIAAGGRLDLGSGELIIASADLGVIEALMKSARNGGAIRWMGPGIGTRMAVAYTGLCAAESGAGGVRVKYTYDGDANLDGRIDADDYFRIDSAFLAQQPEPFCRQGDFNFDDVINADDYFLIDSAFLGQGAPIAASAPSASATAGVAAASGDARDRQQNRPPKPEGAVVWETRTRRRPARKAR